MKYDQNYHRRPRLSTMKCVRVVGQGVPVRYSNAKARQIVEDGDGEYCTKQFWKHWWDGLGYYRLRDGEELHKIA